MKINGIENFKKLNFQKSFILSALNLAFLGYKFKKKIKPKRNYLLWPDGEYALKFGFDKKIPGRKLPHLIKLPCSISNIIIYGNLEKKEKLFLYKKFKKKIIYCPLPHLNIDKLAFKIKKLPKKTFCIITLPTPKQEILANIIARKSERYQILCIGGGLRMSLNEKKISSNFFVKNNLEFIWRLNNDFSRRLRRLLYSYFSYLFYVKIIYKIRASFIKKII